MTLEQAKLQAQRVMRYKKETERDMWQEALVVLYDELEKKDGSQTKDNGDTR